MPPAKRPPPKRPAKRAARQRAAPLVDVLAQAAWAEADSALAEALVECERAIEADNKDTREDALSMLHLALGRAARRRGLTRLGKPGAVEAFDAARHDIAAGKRAPTRVRITEPGVARGGEVLIKARVKRAQAKRK